MSFTEHRRQFMEHSCRNDKLYNRGHYHLCFSTSQTQFNNHGDNRYYSINHEPHPEATSGVGFM